MDNDDIEPSAMNGKLKTFPNTGNMNKRIDVIRVSPTTAIGTYTNKNISVIKLPMRPIRSKTRSLMRFVKKESMKKTSRISTPQQP